MTDDPRTVTFGGSSQDEAYHRATRRGERWMMLFLGRPTIALALVVVGLSTVLAVSLASGWWETGILVITLDALAVILTGLPIAAALMSRSYQADTRLAMRVWWALIGVSTLAIIAFVLQLSPQDRTIYGPSEQAERLRAGVTDTIWYYSRHCRAPENDTQWEECNPFLTAMQNSPVSADWSPQKLLSVASSMPDGPYRQAMVLCLLLLAIIGAGQCGRWYILGSSESYRLGSGEASALPSGQLETPLQPSEAFAALTPAEMFGLWANSRLAPVQGESVEGGLAHLDYAHVCRLNGVEPLNPTKFGNMMTARAASSQGRVIKEKTGGKIRYRGWRLALDPKPNGAGHGHEYGSLHG